MQLSSGTRYSLEQQIAEGGMGAVYRGTLHSPAGQRTVAIKRLLPTKLVTADATLRLTSEARLVFRLNHANVCQVLDLGTDGHEIYVIMEYVHGLDLGRLVQWHRRGGTQLDVAHALYIAREVARALDFTHRRTGDDGALLGLVHGDVTPANILLSVEGEVKLSDFGIARAAIASPGNQMRGGTPGFMAPEAERSTMDHRADLYSLGATLWTALVGRRPDTTVDLTALDSRGISPELRALIANMLAPDPGRRPVSAAAVEAGLATELSRRHPGFTPGLLGSHVAAAIAGDTVVDQVPLAAHGTLVSLVESAPAGGAPHTQTFEARRRARPRWLVPLVALVAAGGAIAAVIALTGSHAVHGSSPADAAPHVVMATIDAAVPELVAAPIDAGPSPVIPHPPRPPIHHVEPHVKAAPAAADPGFLTVTAEPWGAVYVDGVRAAPETPAYKLKTKPGVHQVKVFFPDSGTYSASRTVTVMTGQVVAVGFRR